MQTKKELLENIKKNLIDIKKIYGNNNMKIIFNIPGKTEDPEKISAEIREFY